MGGALVFHAVTCCCCWLDFPSAVRPTISMTSSSAAMLMLPDFSARRGDGFSGKCGYLRDNRVLSARLRKVKCHAGPAGARSLADFTRMKSLSHLM